VLQSLAYLHAQPARSHPAQHTRSSAPAERQAEPRVAANSGCTDVRTIIAANGGCTDVRTIIAANGGCTDVRTIIAANGGHAPQPGGCEQHGLRARCSTP
jgi:hypothetical protein